MGNTEGRRILIYCVIVAALIALIVMWWRWADEQIPEEPKLPGDFFAPKAYTYRDPAEKKGPVVPLLEGTNFLTGAPAVFIGELTKAQGGAGFTVRPTNVIKQDEGVTIPPSLPVAALPKGVDKAPEGDPLPVLVRLVDGKAEVTRLTGALAETAYFIKRQYAVDPLKDTALEMILLEHRWDRNAGRDVIVGLFAEKTGFRTGSHVELVVTEDSALDDQITGLPVVLTRFGDMDEQRNLSCPSYGAWRMLKLMETASGLPEGAAAKTVEGEVLLQRFNWMKAALASCVSVPNDAPTALGVYRAQRARRLKEELVSPAEVLQDRERQAEAAQAQ